MDVVANLEKQAYLYAKEEYCLSRASDRIAMPELFDYIIGTQSGSIAAAILSIPDTTGTSAKYFAEDIRELF